MNIPNFLNSKPVDKDGNWTPEWSLIMQQLISALQTNLSDEGFRIPQQTEETIKTLQKQFLASANPTIYYGDILYDVDNNVAKINIMGAFLTIQTV